MPTSTDTYYSKFGLLKIGIGPEDNFIWTVNIDVSNGIYSGQIPIYIFTNDPIIPKRLIELAETIVLNIDQYLEKSVLFIKRTLTEQRDKYKIKENEYEFLTFDINCFQVDLPELKITPFQRIAALYSEQKLFD